MLLLLAYFSSWVNKYLTGVTSWGLQSRRLKAQEKTWILLIFLLCHDNLQNTYIVHAACVLKEPLKLISHRG